MSIGNHKTHFQKLPQAAKLAIGLFGVSGLAAGLFSIALQPSFDATRILLLLAIGAAGARSKVNLYRGTSISFLTAVVLFAVISEGPAVAVLVAVCGVTVQTIQKKAALHQVVFNAGMIAITVMLTWWTYDQLSGVRLLETMSAEMTTTVLASFVYFLSNSVSVSLIVAMTQERSTFRTWSDQFLNSAPSFLIAGMLALGVMGLDSTNSLILPVALIAVISITYYGSIRSNRVRSDGSFTRLFDDEARGGNDRMAA